MKTTFFTFVLLFSNTLFLPAGKDVDQEIENLEAFAKLYGYVRFFHPSDEAAGIDWDAFAVHGAERVRDAADAGECLARLRKLFLPIAPTLKLFPSGSRIEDPVQPLPEDTSALKLVAWRHFGVGLGGSPLYQSGRSHRGTKRPSGNPFGNILQAVDAVPLRGKTIRLAMKIKTKVTASHAAQAWMRVDRPNRQVGFFDNMADRPVRNRDWQTVTIEGPVAPDATHVYFGCMLIKEGKLWVDDVHLAVENSEGRWEPVELQNPGFEAHEIQLSGWATPTRDYRFTVESGAAEGRRCAAIASSEDATVFHNFEKLPPPGWVLERALNASLSCKMLVTLYSDEQKTLGQADAEALDTLEQALAKVDKDRTENRAVRDAAVIIAWNVFQHFYPYWDRVEVDWPAVLIRSLQGTRGASDAASFLKVLELLVAHLHDGHGRVYHAEVESQLAGLPFLCDWVEDQAVVVVSENSTVQVGDVVTGIDGRSAAEIVVESERYLSGSPRWKRHRAMLKFGRGLKGSEARLEISRGGRRLAVSLTRDFEERLRERDYDKVTALGDGVFYVDLDLAEMDLIEKEVPRLAEAKGIVFDLRGYPKGNHEVLGYLTEKPVHTPVWKVPKIIYPDRQGITWYESGWSIQPRKPRFKGKIVFLTHGGAISYAETFMSMVDHFRLGEIVGQPTAGANGNINPFHLPGGYRVIWTGMRVDRHDGDQHHLVGIRPTIPVFRTLQGIREGRDEYLEKALALIHETSD